MPFVIEATPTEDALKYIPQYLMAGGFGAQQVSLFRMGMGGWETAAVGRIPRTPDPTLRRVAAPLLQDIDIIVDSTRVAADKRYNALGVLPDFAPNGGLGYYEGVPTAQVFESPSTLKITCTLPAAVAPSPHDFWEIGIFTPHPDTVTYPTDLLMLAYGTFPKQTNGSVDITTYVRLSFGRI